jgi:hypothetical protein
MTRMLKTIWISILLVRVVELHAGSGVGLSNLFSLELRPVATAVGAITAKPLPQQPHLSTPYPNPFNSSVSLSYQIFAGPERHVEISIFGADGQRVRRLHSGSLSVGIHYLRWNGRSDAGRTVGSGVYFAVIDSQDGGQARKLVFLQ